MTAASAHCPTALLPAIRQVINNGTITGFVQFTGGNNSILNNGIFNLRHFADTNGDGIAIRCGSRYRTSAAAQQQLHQQRNAGAARQ